MPNVRFWENYNPLAPVVSSTLRPPSGKVGQGKSLERFYATPFYTPTRAALMTARDPIKLGTANDRHNLWIISYFSIVPFDTDGLTLLNHKIQIFKSQNI